MDEPLTISKKEPDHKSQDFELLRTEALNYIQNLSGKIWTDYNTHDPGITILEVLCYAITDLGLRASFDIKDLIALPDSEKGNEIHNFFTASEILPNAPVTYADYRKLMIDVEVYDPANTGCEHAGVKNAWIEKADGPEIDVYVNRAKSELGYEPEKPGDAPLELKILHNVLLEFDSCEKFGDLNENKLVADLVIADHDPDEELEGLTIRIDVEFPRWDDSVTDWEDNSSITDGISTIEILFLNLPGNFEIDYDIDSSNRVSLSGNKISDTGLDPIDGLSDIEDQINDFIFQDTDTSMITLYRQKIGKVLEIVEKVKARLHANRNLCEDFVEFRALRIEEILMCADIELQLDADVEEVQAEMYHNIAKFLSPTVLFYSLNEMMTRCFDEFQYTITEINRDERFFRIDESLSDVPEKGERISITDSNNNNGVYTISKVEVDEGSGTSKVYVSESISSEILTEGEKLYLANLEEDQCSPTEQIFDGPRLEHGFIDDNELALADRKSVIHVSDLIQIIMDIEGVLAVRNLQIANRPQDNESGLIPEKSVRWCLKLAFEQNYVPRLNKDDSKVTFFKDQLPFKAKQTEVDAIIDDLESFERSQKLYNTPLDITPPRGRFRNIEDYESIQNEFPLVYGIGEEGLPASSEKSTSALSDIKLPDKARARQLKGFLMHFDQLLANYLSQLAHVKDLFSMNPQRNEFGEFVIGRTYYTQPLFDIVANSQDLYVDVAGHLTDLNKIAESDEVFADRRNRFLDHLAARFAEKFTDYAMLITRISGKKAPEDLIEDKLAFLNGYPEMSYRRGTGFDYLSPCAFWSNGNISGLARRASLLTGIDEPLPSELVFNPNFKISESGGEYSFLINNSVPDDLLKSSKTYESLDEAKLAIERLIVSGVLRKNYRIVTEDETDYSIELYCGEELIAESVKTDYSSGSGGGDADLAIDECINLLRDEFFNNPQSNLLNLTCALHNYFKVSTSVDMAANPPSFTITYELFETPFDFSGDPILTGSYTGDGEARWQADILSVNTGASTIKVEGDVQENLVVGDTVIINESGTNDGAYTIDSFSLSGDDTDIVVNEAITSDTAPLGVALINQVTEAEMTELAETSVDDVLWRVIANGVKRARYGFDPGTAPFTSPYRFQIRDFRGAVLGASEAADFNNVLAIEIENTSNTNIRVYQNDDTGIEYSVVSASASGPHVNITIDGTFSPTPAYSWKVAIYDEFILSGINEETRVFEVETDLTTKLREGDQIYIKDSMSNDGDYTIFGIEFDGTTSSIRVKEPIPSGTVEGPDISTDPLIGYSKQFDVVKSTSSVITIAGKQDEQAVQDMINFLQTKFFNREGMHVIEHILLRPKANEATYQDSLLPINLDDECECALENPYTCMAHVVMPYWPGRFTNKDFRRFFENTLRREAPAHVYLTVCWVSCKHMAEFERTYKAWLIERSQAHPDPESLSNALNEFINSIEQLRNVYPGGTLHDCEENDDFEDSIILNNSVLGEI